MIVAVLLLCIPRNSSSQVETSSAIKHKITGQWRSAYMLTENEGALKDFEALATGGRLNYLANTKGGWEMGIGIYSSFNLGISDLQEADPITGRYSRFEEGLFNRLDLNQSAVVLLGEANVSFSSTFGKITVGRFKINTPQINTQDGRMIPTLVQGGWLKREKKGRYKLQAGILNRVAPRSTGNFMKIGESIGAYPAGRDVTGNPSKYPGNTNSDFIAILNTEWNISSSVKLDMWNYYTDNIFNTLNLKPQWEISNRWGLDFEWLHQDKVGDGGNSNPELSYFDQNNSDVLGMQLRHTNGSAQFKIGYDRILPGGRFLFPREWGREYFFSFQKLERSEGSSDNHALVITYSQPFMAQKEVLRIRPTLSLGRHWKASVLSPEENKYALPDYTHINLDVYLDFLKLPNFHPEVILTYKDANGLIPENPNFIINKVNLFHLSLFLNYNF